jgi:formate hydrogenlyase subunit 6/NADH:ubiquinone oxidoreductase subunit I/predicted flap endonuclease-1-like 5' DNA nuclease
MNDITRQEFDPDRVTSDLKPTLWKPQTVQYPYERLEDMEPWLFVPGNYNGRIGVIWETCTACKMCVNICPNDCLHMTTELRVDVLDNADGENAGLGMELEVGKFAAVEVPEVMAELDSFNHVTAHTDAPEEWRFAEVLDLSGTSATVRWNDSGEESVVSTSELYPADDQIVSGRIDLGRCMFCGLCMESCGFTSFFMTNEYDGMSGFTRQDLWFDASRTRVLPGVHQEAVDAELAKRASKERDKRAKKAAKAAKAAVEAAKPAEVAVETVKPAEVEVETVKPAEPEAEPVAVEAKPLSKEEKKKAELDRVKERSKTIDFNVLGTADASEKDDLQAIKGVGPFIEEKLNALGIYTFSQVSKMNSDLEEQVNQAIEFFPGRVKRDEWANQAKVLLDETAKGDA